MRTQSHDYIVYVKIKVYIYTYIPNKKKSLKCSIRLEKR